MSPLCLFWQSDNIIAKQHFLSFSCGPEPEKFVNLQGIDFQPAAGTTTLFDVPARQAA